jgi:integrase
MSTTSRIKLTRRAIEASIAAHRTGQRERHWFTDSPSMYLQITPNGCASYCLRFARPGGGKGDYTIGKVTRITPDMAREAATARLAALTLNSTDPCEERRATRSKAHTRRLETFAALAGTFMASPENMQLAERTRQDRHKILEAYLLPQLGGRSVESITRRDVKDCLRAVQTGTRAAKENQGGSGGNRTANKAHEVVRRVFSWAVEEERCATNPASFRKLFDDTAVKRVGILNDVRIRTIWEALDQEANLGWGKPSVLAIKLCLVTLQRPNEVCQAHRDDIDFASRVWSIPEHRTKTNTRYEVPLSELAAELLLEAFTLSGSAWAFLATNNEDHLHPNVLTHRFGKMRRRLLLDKKLPSADVQLYDARRFGRTMLVQRLGFPKHIAESVINHAPDRSMGGRYDVGDYSGEIRRAHEAWARELLRIVYQVMPPANVVPLQLREAAE